MAISLLCPAFSKFISNFKSSPSCSTEFITPSPNFLWYTVTPALNLLKSTPSVFVLFSEFKNKQNRGYECLARLYIKLPFLNLQQIPITTTTIYGCVENQLKKINEEVGTLFENGDLEEILNYVDVSEKDIEKEMKKLEEK